MAALVTLQTAKEHLQVTDEASNSDIDRKIEQASAIVLDYLSGRIATVYTITSASAVATTTFLYQHGLSTGDTILVSGAAQAEYNGAFAVTVTSPTEVTFAITGTPVSPATGTLSARVRKTWTTETVPGHVQAVVLLWLTHLYENRGEDMKALEALWSATRVMLARSRDEALA